MNINKNVLAITHLHSWSVVFKIRGTSIGVSWCDSSKQFSELNIERITLLWTNLYAVSNCLTTIFLPLGGTKIQVSMHSVQCQLTLPHPTPQKSKTRTKSKKEQTNQLKTTTNQLTIETELSDELTSTLTDEVPLSPLWWLSVMEFSLDISLTCCSSSTMGFIAANVDPRSMRGLWMFWPLASWGEGNGGEVGVLSGESEPVWSPGVNIIA